MTSEQIHEMCRLQHKIFITEALMNDMPPGYLGDDFNQLIKDVKIVNIHDDCIEQMNNILSSLGTEAVASTFSNKEIMKRPENRFTFEEQRQATKEVLGIELTLEEFIDKFCQGMEQ